MEKNTFVPKIETNEGAQRIVSVSAGGIAARCGLQPGDALCAINGEPVLDQVDYQFLTTKRRIVLTVQDAQGATREIAIRKREEEPLGLVFSSTLMSKPRLCRNKCAFCFIDQMPPGMRQSLYVKDDDWRLSLMMGNYITLTNLSEAEFARILARHASPLYISVHATDPQLRIRLMRNPSAGGILEQLRRLAQGGISFHCQIVLCPGINDGDALEKTLTDLTALYPAARSAALVPVGLTGFREGLAALSPYTKLSAGRVLDQAEAWQEKMLARTGTRFVFAADELYCLAERELPPEEAYEEYPQLENGVGLLRSFSTEFFAEAKRRQGEMPLPRRVLIATGESAAPWLRSLLAQAPFSGVETVVLPVKNRFFGGHVTVTGLLTGTDLAQALKGCKADEVLLSQSMLRHEGGVFLDGMPLEALEAQLGIPIHPVENDGADFFSAMLGEKYQQEESKCP